MTYADQSPNIIVSGSDDTSIKVCGVGVGYPCALACVTPGQQRRHQHQGVWAWVPVWVILVYSRA